MYDCKQIENDRRKFKKDSIYHTPEFKKLQMKWYTKLDKTGFVDIERSGKKRQKLFDEYGGILQKPLSVLKHRIDSFAFHRLHRLTSFSWYSGSLQPLQSQLLEITSKGCSEVTPDLKNKTTNTVQTKLSTSDRCILRQIGQGNTITEVSNYLRRYHAKHVDYSRKTGPTGKAYSVYYVHTRLHYLEKLATVWDSLGQPEKL